MLPKTGGLRPMLEDEFERRYPEYQGKKGTRSYSRAFRKAQRDKSQWINVSSALKGVREGIEAEEAERKVPHQESMANAQVRRLRTDDEMKAFRKRDQSGILTEEDELWDRLYQATMHKESAMGEVASARSRNDQATADRETLIVHTHARSQLYALEHILEKKLESMSDKTPEEKMNEMMADPVYKEYLQLRMEVLGTNMSSELQELMGHDPMIQSYMQLVTLPTDAPPEPETSAAAPEAAPSAANPMAALSATAPTPAPSAASPMAALSATVPAAAPSAAAPIAAPAAAAPAPSLSATAAAPAPSAAPTAAPSPAPTAAPSPASTAASSSAPTAALSPASTAAPSPSSPETAPSGPQPNYIYVLKESEENYEAEIAAAEKAYKQAEVIHDTYGMEVAKARLMAAARVGMRQLETKIQEEMENGHRLEQPEQKKWSLENLPDYKKYLKLRGIVIDQITSDQSRTDPVLRDPAMQEINQRMQAQSNSGMAAPGMGMDMGMGMDPLMGMIAPMMQPGGEAGAAAPAPLPSELAATQKPAAPSSEGQLQMADAQLALQQLSELQMLYGGGQPDAAQAAPLPSELAATQTGFVPDMSFGMGNMGFSMWNPMWNPMWNMGMGPLPEAAGAMPPAGAGEPGAAAAASPSAEASEAAGPHLVPLTLPNQPMAPMGVPMAPMQPMAPMVPGGEDFPADEFPSAAPAKEDDTKELLANAEAVAVARDLDPPDLREVEASEPAGDTFGFNSEGRMQFQMFRGVSFLLGTYNEDDQTHGKLFKQLKTALDAFSRVQKNREAVGSEEVFETMIGNTLADVVSTMTAYRMKLGNELHDPKLAGKAEDARRQIEILDQVLPVAVADRQTYAGRVSTTLAHSEQDQGPGSKKEGGVNTVTRFLRNGKSAFFKPRKSVSDETETGVMERIGIEPARIRTGGNTAHDPRLANREIAYARLGALLGSGVTVGAKKAVIGDGEGNVSTGVLMEEAKGRSWTDYRWRYHGLQQDAQPAADPANLLQGSGGERGETLLDRLSGSGFSLGEKESNAVIDAAPKDTGPALDMANGDFQRQMNEMFLLDTLAGHTDRHMGNFLVDRGEGNSISVKAIDNDLTFGALGSTEADKAAFGKRGQSFNYGGLPAEMQIDAKMAAKIRNVNKDLLQAAFSDLLEQKEIDALWARFEMMQEYIGEMEKKGRLVSEWNAQTAQTEVGLAGGINSFAKEDAAHAGGYSGNNYYQRQMLMLESASRNYRDLWQFANGVKQKGK